MRRVYSDADQMGCRSESSYRSADQFKLGKVDAASKDHAQKLEGFEAFFGDVYVQFQDVILSIEDRNLEISKPEDLESLSIVAFQTAPDHYP